MSNRPPSPDTPVSRPTITNLPSKDDRDARVLATTPQLAAAIEGAVDLPLDEGVLEELLLELSHRGYVEMVDISPNGEYIWDLTESPEKIADAVAAAVADRFTAWVSG